MRSKESDDLLAKGLEALERDHLYLARTCFEQALDLDRNPEVFSYLALCQAKTRGNFSDAIKMAEEAVATSPDDPLMYLNLAKIYILAGKKELAMKMLRDGVQHDTENQNRRELERQGNRKPPVFPALSRSHPLNKYLGILLSKLRLR